MGYGGCHGQLPPRAATNTVTLHCGTNDTPHLSFGLNVPRAFFATNGADVVVSFHSDIPTNGTISVADTSLASVLEEGPPWNWTLGDGTRDFCVTNRIRASAPSLMPEDIELTATFTLEGDQPTDVPVTTTAVVLQDVIVPSAPDTGLVVLAGSSVAMEVKCHPHGADLSEAETDWFLGRRRRDGSHDNWQKVATNESGVVYSCPFSTGGVYRVKADVTLAGATCHARFWRFVCDADIDPPDVIGDGYVGVASTLSQITLRETAFSHLGETGFAEGAYLPPYYGFDSVGKGKWKCNAFVAYCICQAGLTVPRKTSFLKGIVYPPSANSWALKPISGWAKAGYSSLEPGLVVGHPASVGSGHCGIVDFDGYAIGAGKFKVTRLFEDFLDGSCGYNRWIGE